MKEIRSIIAAYHSIDLHTIKAALVTVVRVEGSSYRSMGARMLVLDDGTYLGGISGGCLEGDALRKALHAIGKNKPSIVTYDTTQEDEQRIGAGLGCNGIIDVLFTPLHAQDKDNPVQLLPLLANSRTPSILVTITGGAPGVLGRTFLYRDETRFLQDFALPALAPRVLADIQSCKALERSASIEYEGGIRLFIEYIAPALHLLIYGGNYDVPPLVRLAWELGWDVTVVTSLLRANKTQFQPARLVDWNQAQALETDRYTAAVLMNHDYASDLAQLQQILHSLVPYIGILGPRKRSLRLFNDLVAGGLDISSQDGARIFAPAGLDIGADTPEEIALSIVAEIKSCFAKRPGMSLRLRPGAIHDHELK